MCPNFVASEQACPALSLEILCFSKSESEGREMVEKKCGI